LAEKLWITDEAVMGLVKAGSRRDLSVLMRGYANSLLTFLRRLTGDHHLSEELFQDVFLAVWNQRLEYEYPRSFRSWLFGIAVNKSRTSHRSRKPQSSMIDSDQSAADSSATESPHETAIATETAAIVERAVLQLPELQRQVVVLRVWNGLSYQAIGQILGHSEATARSHMFHALNSMRRFLEPRFCMGEQ
jgi:RNA polymerase sigma-70 factor (ECF subfamily)